MAGGRPWTADEDALIQQLWPRGAAARRRLRTKLARQGRTSIAITHRAYLLRVPSQSWVRWTAAEIAYLRREWGEVGEHTLCRSLPRHSWTAIHRYAVRTLGLPAGAPQGHETFASAMQRTGLDRPGLLRALAAVGEPGPRKHHGYRPRLRRRWLVVDTGAVDRALEWWNATERLPDGARRRGLHPETLYRRLRAMGALPPRQACRGNVPRVSSELLDRAAALRPGGHGWRRKPLAGEVAA